MLPGQFVWCRVQLSRAQVVVRGGELKVASLRVPLTLDWSLGLCDRVPCLTKLPPSN
jgi:hypothetical protein